MTAAALINELKGIMARAGIDEPVSEAAWIIKAVLGLSHTDLLLRRAEEVSELSRARAVAMARRRAGGEPLQYILGEWSFMGRGYAVGDGVLIPRDDTEVVVRAALNILKNVPSPTVADLCAGSGIIAVTLAKELDDPTVIAVEKSPEAYAYLTKNIAAHHTRVRAIRADLCDCADDIPDGTLDLLVSNPPYIPHDELPTLQREVQYEPRLALDGGADGCDLYRAILRLWTPKLKTGGAIALELGEEQFEPVSRMLTAHGYTDIRGYEDIQGTVRAVTAVHASNAL